MKFGLRFALLAQTKCQNMAPRLSRVTRLSTSSPSYDYASEDCTVVFDADGAFCMEDSHMNRATALDCLATDECDVPEFQEGALRHQ